MARVVEVMRLGQGRRFGGVGYLKTVGLGLTLALAFSALVLPGGVLLGRIWMPPVGVHGATPANTLVIASSTTPTGMDRDRDLTVMAQRIVKNINDQLYEYPLVTLPNGLRSIDSKGFGSKFTPLLASRAPEISADGHVYTIRLRRGVKSR